MTSRSWLKQPAITTLLLATILVMAAWAFAQVSNPDLTQLGDVDLFLHEQQDVARTILDHRMESYTPAEKARFRKEVMEEIQRRRASRQPLDIDVILDRIRDDPSGTRSADAIMALRERFALASDAEKSIIRQRFLEDWDSVPYPPIDDERPDARTERRLFEVYLDESPHLFDDEQAFIEMLKYRCLNRGIVGEVELFLRGLQAQGENAGPLSASEVERCFGDYAQWSHQEFGYGDRGEMLPYMYTILANSGRPGLDVLVRLKKTETENGLRALGGIDDPEAEKLLWEIYAGAEEKSITYRVKVLLALQMKQKRAPTDQRRDRIRKELVRYLEIPEEPFYLADIRYAVQVAGLTGDRWFLPHLEALEPKLRGLRLDQAKEINGDPGNATQLQDSTLKSIQKAHETLMASH